MFRARYQLRYCPENQGEIMRSHFHNEVEFLMPLSKGGNLLIEDRIYSLEPGTLFVLREHTLHHLSTKGAPYARYILHVDPTDIETFSTPDTDFLKRLTSSSHAIDISRDMQRMIGYMATLEQTQDMDFGSDVRRAICFVQFLLEASCMIDQVREVPQSLVSSNMSRVLRIQNFIREHSAEPLTLEYLAGKFFISKYHLSHIFKEASNYSIIEYLNYCRISNACYRLRESDDIVAVGEQIGFGSNEQFVRSFKLAMGMTPHQYHKKYREAVRVNPAAEGR